MAKRNGELWRDVYYASFDDLRLHVRHYPAAAPIGRPVLCLPGLTRNSKDFHVLASALARHPERPREVYCVDYRGRGASQYDRNWRNYTPHIELIDALDFMALRDLNRAAIVGTSRGGIIAMLMAAARPAAMRAVVLNDIGPVLEAAGLARIMSYVGRMQLPRSWEEAALQLRALNARDFPGLEDRQWEEMAHSIFNEGDGRPAEGYDQRLGRSLTALDFRRGLPNLWPQFLALAQVPALVIRGANSDLLSAETVAAMAARHHNLDTLTVPGQGHAPLLNEPETVESIGTFLAAND